MTASLLSPVLIALAIAVIAVAWWAGGLVDQVRATPWPQPVSPGDREERGRDAGLEHLVRVLHASTMDEAHRIVTDLVTRRLAGLPAAEGAALRAAVQDFLERPPGADRETYLTALEAALDRIEGR